VDNVARYYHILHF